jgi:transposase
MEWIPWEFDLDCKNELLDLRRHQLEHTMSKTEDKERKAGIDVSKNELVARFSVDTRVRRYGNSPVGIRELIRDLIRTGITFVVCEHTGRYEWELLQSLWKKRIAVHCAHPKAIHHYAKALKINGKSDPIDAGVILDYALGMKLQPTEPPSEELTALRGFVSRREDLNKMLVDEKNRLTAPALSSETKRSLKEHIRYLEKMLDAIEQEMRALVAKHDSLKAPIDCLDEEYGVAFITAASVYAIMPELGTLDRQSSAALAGLAPFIRTSGKFSGQRKIFGGRTAVRTTLYMVAMTAIRKKRSPLQLFYLRLKAAGKHSNVALTAVMRKIIIRLNTRMKEFLTMKQKTPIPA